MTYVLVSNIVAFVLADASTYLVQRLFVVWWWCSLTLLFAGVFAACGRVVVGVCVGLKWKQGLVDGN